MVYQNSTVPSVSMKIQFTLLKKKIASGVNIGGGCVMGLNLHGRRVHSMVQWVVRAWLGSPGIQVQSHYATSILSRTYSTLTSRSCDFIMQFPDWF